MDCSTSGSSVLHCLPEFGQIQATELVMLSNHLILCSPLLLPSIFPSIRVFSCELALCIRWPNIEISASASVLLVNIEGWFPLRLTGPSYSPRESKFQHHNSKVSVLWCSAFFMFQLSHLYMTTGKTIGLTYRPLLAKWYLCILILSRFVIAFLPRSKCLLISWLQSLSPVILDPKKIKSVTVSISSPSVCQVMGQDAMILVFWMLSFKPAFHPHL